MPSEEAFKAVDLITVQAALLGFDLECPGDYKHHETLCECKGTRVRYPFRLACPGTVIYGGEEPETCWNGRLTGNRFDPNYNERQCETCAGLGFLFNPDPDVLWEAAEDKGWDIVLDTGMEGGITTVMVGVDWRGRKELSRVTGLRGQAALQTALAKAQEAE